MRRIQLALVFVVATPVGLALASQGCGPSEPSVEDLCGWLQDPNNCYRKFAEDVGTRCGGAVGTRAGSFISREKLDICIVTSGGQVVFDPPLVATAFPPAKVAFKVVNPIGTDCGSGSFTAAVDGSKTFTFTDDGKAATCDPKTIPGKEGFSISVVADPIPDGGGGGTSGAGGGASTLVAGGTFSSTPTTQRDVFDVACPGGETHHFNRLQACYCQQNINSDFPRAELVANPGGIGVTGSISLSVFYPSVDGTDNTVEYFNCEIPGASSTCSNGIQDPDEPATDCGALCGVGCSDGSPCNIHADCASKNCALMGGLTTCAASPCSDGVKNGVETDIDCGGGTCTGCANGKACNTGTDCQSMQCDPMTMQCF